MLRINNGDVFGRWTVIRQVESHPKFRYRQYLCRCKCGTERYVNVQLLRTGRSISCGCRMADWNKERRGEKHPCWKGGRSLDSSGYVQVRFWGPDGELVTYREHTHVMEQHLGRKLFPGENVHHKNGRRADNRFENLELWTTTQPAGQRPEDLLVWAHEIIDRYEA